METKQPVASAHPSTVSPRILIIIVTWNKQQYVLDLLQSLTQIQVKADLDIVVVDNASEDDTVRLLKQQHPDVHLICNSENIGGTGGFNTGLDYAFSQPEDKYQYLWLLDNDVVVHQHALQALLNVLQQNDDIAVAGSTMMQLDYPWRINEMGAFIDKAGGLLVLNRHHQEINAWKGQDVNTLLTTDPDLSKSLMHCQAMMDVDYVAAASLLIRAPVAKQIGLWRDYFIHFDDVEWCLRIRDAGHRVVVSAQSLIWHLSAAAKVPTWLLYYDNRNLLSLLSHHGADAGMMKNAKKRVLLKSLYYALLGKPDLSRLHKQAVDDFEQNNFGKKDMQLTTVYQPISYLQTVLKDPLIKRVLISYSVDLQASNSQSLLIQAQLQRPDLQIQFLTHPAGRAENQIPQAQFIFLPANRFKRLRLYWSLKNQYDMVVQSDYQPVLGVSWIARKILFINNEGVCLSDKPKTSNVWTAFKWWLRA